MADINYLQSISDFHYATKPLNINMEEERSKKRKTTYDKMYDMEMLDYWSLNGHNIQRVPGGWIFDRTGGAVFVPYVEKEINNLQLKL